MIPRHGVRAMNDVVAHERADRNEDRFDRVAGIGGDLFEDHAEVALDGAEDALIVANEIHLVDRDQNVANAEKRRDVSMAARLHAVRPSRASISTTAASAVEAPWPCSACTARGQAYPR